jgi:cobalt-zinc-cadmium resistance protein CzcA
VDRENAQRYSVIQSNVRDRDLVGFVNEARAAVSARVALPPGYRLAWGGQFENQQRAASRLGFVVPIALGLIFVLLFSTFGSVRQALLILAMVPFALVGASLPWPYPASTCLYPPRWASSHYWALRCSMAW